ncbi:HEAT repeat domain-containing protein [Niabella yanshanensis]|uniref:HEAT repeat domain-containing protein n=1 Tax=Niabella yanshanensis TaxID=577386 RepID=A0ABZ0WDI9_9BACT|nr:HEAT repeat domain-containing protein [Niabella yanshanensis]WQD40762.1 HEAT repeat domain-containing protein [Niabella yanshanensis]
MAFYDLAKDDRAALSATIKKQISDAVSSLLVEGVIVYFTDADTYIRKAGYLAIGRIYFEQEHLQSSIIILLNQLLDEKDFKVRQTVINAAGEIGKKDFEVVKHFFEKGLFDVHHSPRNAVIGSIKKMGEVNPVPVLAWAKKYLHHEDKEIRREICHGIELRGRKYPEDILPLLMELQHDETARVRNTLVHVIGQIAYKKDCLATVVANLKSWDNRQLVMDALEEIIDVHHRYRGFAVLTQEEARQYIIEHFNDQ